MAEPIGDGLTLVSLISSGNRDLGTTAYSRAWRIPAESAEAFAAAMTERYGPPIHEGLSTVGALVEKAQDGKVLFWGREPSE